MFRKEKKKGGLNIFKFEESMLIDLGFGKIYLVCKYCTVPCNACFDAFRTMETSSDTETVLTIIWVNSDTSFPVSSHPIG